VVVGESLVDLIWHAGAKTPQAVAGGSPANVALGLHRLGHDVTLLTCWGDNPAGDLVGRHLDATGMRVVRAPSESGRTTLAFAWIDARTGAAEYEFMPAWDPIELTIDDGAVLLHTGSLAAVVEPGADRVLAACADVRLRANTAVAIDLNVRPAVQPDRRRYRTAIESLLRVADVVKASDEDLAWLWPGCDVVKTSRGLLDHGPRLVVLTRGAQGAVAHTADATVAVRAPRVRVVDTIGAGDSFHAALLSGLVGTGVSPVRIPSSVRELEDLLRRAVVAGALATTRIGAQPPTLVELTAVVGDQRT
jgi:fructokinase